MINTFITILSAWIIPLLIVTSLIYAQRKGVRVFDAFVEGAKEGFSTSVLLIPFLVAMLVAISLFTELGAMDFVIGAFEPIFDYFHIPKDIVPLALMRPVSGSSTLAITTEIFYNQGPDSFLGRLASTMQGSTDTTLFVITVYFGSVGIRKTRHALHTGLIADFAGFASALIVCSLVF